eukprot:TRINITY_DN47528_c0_g1_i6.p1 TRINITY_DN47528_c0_g1~~TRINITY_DN47528_c0_g1_i6.p1  ORF type:complete len:147 (-),score=23.06 TRINITY_DN47528_c0_g1_i6:140-580(-)
MDFQVPQHSSKMPDSASSDQSSEHSTAVCGAVRYITLLNARDTVSVPDFYSYITLLNTRDTVSVPDFYSYITLLNTRDIVSVPVFTLLNDFYSYITLLNTRDTVSVPDFYSYITLLNTVPVFDSYITLDSFQQTNQEKKRIAAYSL